MIYYILHLKVHDQPQPEKNEDKVKEFFRKLAGDDMEVDWMELKEILDYAMRKGKLIFTNVKLFNIINIIIGTFSAYGKKLDTNLI